jgi:hypothetical protein
MLVSGVHLFASLSLIALSLSIIGWSVYDIIFNLQRDAHIIPKLLHCVSAIIIAAAIVDVAQYMMEEEVFLNKELRDPVEARKTITKIIVIITIAVSIEGLVFIFKAGMQDLTLLIYPAMLIAAAAFLIVALGVYQKLSSTVEKVENQ